MNRFARPALLLLAAAFAVGAATAGSAADPGQDLHKAFVHNLSLKSYQATMTDLRTNRLVSTVQYQSPNRYRMTVTGQQPSVIIDDVMYMRVDGKVMKVPMPKGSIGKYRNEASIAEFEKGAHVTSIGPGMVGKEPAIKYGFASDSQGSQSNSTAWVSARSGHVLMVETAGKSAGRDYAMRVVYSDFDSPAIRITAPH